MRWLLLQMDCLCKADFQPYRVKLLPYSPRWMRSWLFWLSLEFYGDILCHILYPGWLVEIISDSSWTTCLARRSQAGSSSGLDT